MPLPSRFRSPTIRTVRLYSGLILFTYVTTHLLNHGMGNVSLAWMERWLRFQKFVWQSVPGAIALYGALGVHFVLGLWALYERRRMHWTASELLQLLLGLAIPPLLANHIAGSGIAGAVFGFDKGYAQILYSFWIATPFFGWVNLTLLVVAWAHGCLGLYFWLRLKPGFARIQSWLFMASVLIPVLALLGYARAGHEVSDLADDPAWVAATMDPRFVGTAAQTAWAVGLRDGFLAVDAIAIVVILLARGVRLLRDRRGGLVRISYPDGQQRSVPIGFSVLEASRLAGIPHASPCGGRARCSLCRIRIPPTAKLPPPSAEEQSLLDHAGLNPASVRLACQLRPRTDLLVIPLVPIGAQASFLYGTKDSIPPQERFLVHLFVDLRDSTQLAATRPPHDSVFVLGRFVAGASAAVLAAGGVPNQFLGDGILALFGLRSDERTACRQALAALGGIARSVRALNALLEVELGQPLRFGIGMQCGATIVGEIGFRDHVTFTGLGDPPNVASRLQAMTKELGCEALVSEDVFHIAGVSGDSLPLHEAQLRGRRDPVLARVFRKVEDEIGMIDLNAANARLTEKA
jgi:adenylate cyclase